MNTSKFKGKACFFNLLSLLCVDKASHLYKLHHRANVQIACRCMGTYAGFTGLLFLKDLGSHAGNVTLSLVKALNVG